MKKYLGRKINLRRLVALAGVFLCILTATSFLDRVWWVFDLTAHFRIQYAIALTTLTATCFLIRRNRFGIIFSVFAVINFWIVIPYCFFGQAPVSPKQVALRALLINVQSENDHYDLVEKFIRDCAPDIVVLEEMDNKWLMHLAALKTVYPHVCEAPKEDHSGIVLFSKLPLKNPETIYLGEAGSPSVTAEIEVGGRPIRILGTHPVPPVGSENTRFEINNCGLLLSR